MVEDDGQQSGICVQWDYYWMKQWGVLGYLASVFWEGCKNVLISWFYVRFYEVLFCLLVNEVVSVYAFCLRILRRYNLESLNMWKIFGSWCYFLFPNRRTYLPNLWLLLVSVKSISNRVLVKMRFKTFEKTVDDKSCTVLDQRRS